MMRTLGRLCMVAVLTSPLASSIYAQASQPARERTPAGEVILCVGGEVERPLRLSAADFARLPRRTVRAKDHDGREATFEGVTLYEVLQRAGVPFGERLRGKNLATYLLVEAADGYRAVFALPELDPAFTDRIILLADRRDGQPLSSQEGRLRIVVPDEKRPARWVRQVVSLMIKQAD
jgi:DMSO/TMAO reductase YedYZ molybdopterin-dependent catalytic subunit